MTQKTEVLRYLKQHGPITPLRAQSEFGVWRLASVINRLRADGYMILTHKRRTFMGKPYAEYHLITR